MSINFVAVVVKIIAYIGLYFGVTSIRTQCTIASNFSSVPGKASIEYT